MVLEKEIKQLRTVNHIIKKRMCASSTIEIDALLLYENSFISLSGNTCLPIF